jgi:hypothetical protein
VAQGASAKAGRGVALKGEFAAIQKPPLKPMQQLGAMTPAVAVWDLDELSRERIEVA